ncbi:MAG: sulfite exporter TauE/SafE family protein [Gammaproteobacteria bacterium]|nr:sulfite exporter TauE/SafE family protein [Gammaproteobacteria bacterium]MDD9959141.1 sulfite exporter TauE/SafE family protein [Gammaproteobacteria bacterium]
MQLDLWSISLLLITGFLAGGINTVAGGGSNLTLPALMVFGLPADIANGTNRVAILMQSLVGVARYDKYQTLDRPAIVPILIPTIIGGIVGALAAAVIPNVFLKPILLGTILTMSVVILVRPDVISPPPGTPTLSPNEHRGAWWGLFAAGVYGGFVQAGVGFILLAALAGGLRYDLIRANALKMACALAFTIVAVAIFIAFDQVWWIPGIILALGSMAGAHLAVKIAVNASQQSIKWFLFVMTLFAVAAGFFL